MTEESQESPEKIAARRAVTHTRVEALGWANKNKANAELVRAEYHRRIQRGEQLLIAWRRALWACFQRSMAK